MKYKFIEKYRSSFSVEKMGKILKCSSSAFYTWQKRQKKPCHRKTEDSLYKSIILKIFNENDGNYGVPRILEALRDLGYRLGSKRIARLMKELDIFASPKAKYKPQTTNSNHNLLVSPNLIKQNFKVNKPNKVWVSDITFIRVANEWMYLCSIIDLFSRKVVGWTFANHMKTEMVCRALKDAIQKHKPSPDLIFHSDQGCQYASKMFRKLLSHFRFKSSMSRKGNCYDNAVAESFFKTIKKELINKRNYKNYSEARNDIFQYIEIYYNRKRKHSYLNYKSPVQFELLQAA